MGARTVDHLFEQYKDRIRLVFKHNPLSFHNNAMPAALYFEAIARQDMKKALVFHDMFFANREKLKKGETALRETASSLGIDMKRLDGDLKGKEVRERVRKDMEEARGFGFSGTPAFIINGMALPGAYLIDEFIEIIRMTEKK